MIDEEIIERLSKRLVERINNTNEYILKEIGKCIKEIGSLTPSKASQLAQILKYGGNYKKIVKRLEELTKLNVKDIEDIFEAVAKENYSFAKQFYDYKGIEYIPYNKNIALQNQVKSLARITIGEYLNLSNTTAIGYYVTDNLGDIVFKGLEESYRQTIDQAVLSVAQGKESFNSSMERTLKTLGRSGLKTIQYESGYTRRLDSAVRLNIMSGLRQMTQDLQKQFGQEFGADGIEISAHRNSAPDHEPVQGRQFKNEEFEKLQSQQPFEDYNHRHYGVIKRPIGEWNCYHTIFSIVLGVSKPTYTEKQLENMENKNKDGFDFEGKHYTNYEGKQLQRKIESEIRKEKDLYILAKASGNNDLKEQTKLRMDLLLDKYNKLSKESGLENEIQRLKVVR